MALTLLRECAELADGDACERAVYLIADILDARDYLLGVGDHEVG